MAYDVVLADRIRELIPIDSDHVEKAMFGGLAFLVGGNMAVVASGQGGVMVRVDPAESERLQRSKGVEPMVMKGRPMAGWLRIEKTCATRAGGRPAGVRSRTADASACTCAASGSSPASSSMVAAIATSGCGLSRGQVACDMAAPPGNPVEVPTSWSQGYAVVIATIGEPDGRTKVYDPGYRADRYDIDVERVVTVRPRIEVPPGDAYATAYTEADVAAVGSIASVHYPDPPSGCGERIEVAELDPGAG